MALAAIPSNAPCAIGHDAPPWTVTGLGRSRSRRERARLTRARRQLWIRFARGRAAIRRIRSGSKDGAAARTLAQCERDLARLWLHHPRAGLDELTADEYRRTIASFPPLWRKRVTAVYRDFSRWLYQ